jgi:transposase
LEAGISKNEETSCPAYDPKILLKVLLFAYARGIISSRKIEQACRENITFMALACGQTPDHSTLAAFVASLKAEITSLFRDILLICAEQDLYGLHALLFGMWRTSARRTQSHASWPLRSAFPRGQ